MSEDPPASLGRRSGGPLSGSPPPTRFAVLGPLEVSRDGVPISIGGPKQRLLLSILLLAAGRVVSTERLVETLWDGPSTSRSAATLHVAIAKLRRVLDDGSRSAASLIVTARPGYRIDVDDASLDLLRFRSLAAHGRQHMVDGEFDAAAQRFREALDLRRGPLLSDLTDADIVREEAVHVERAMLTVTIDAFQCDLRLARHDDAVDRLARLVETNPFDERLCGLLMLALYRSGRQADALEAARRLRTALRNELGVEPGPEVRALERRILTHDERIAAPSYRPDMLDARSTMVRGSGTQPTGSLRIGGRRIALTRTVTTIGRRRDRTVMVPDQDVSRSHAEIRRTGQAFLLVDVGSTNGTCVNGERILEHPLSPGDVIEIGATTLVFEATVVDRPADRLSDVASRHRP